MNRMTRATLGPSFELQEIEFDHGSVHIHAVLVAIEGFYLTVAHCHHFDKSIDLLVRQLRSVICRILGDKVHSGSCRGGVGSDADSCGWPVPMRALRTAIHFTPL